jgi:CRP-like cAMP-binding protein
MAQPQTTPVEQSLQKIALFKDLPSDTLERIQQLCSWRRYEEDKPILVFGDDTSEVFFIAEGAAHVTIYSVDGKEVSFRDLGPGAVFGEYAAIDSSPRSASVEALTGGCVVASMTRRKFRELLGSEPKVTEALLKHLVKELRELTTRVYEFSTLPVNDRIRAEVLRIARHVAPKGNVARIVPAPTHAHIASCVSTHREAVTRELNRLSKEGVIEQQKQACLLVRDIDRLAAMIHEATGE